jgi:hypothetical protein
MAMGWTPPSWITIQSKQPTNGYVLISSSIKAFGAPSKQSPPR